MRVSLTEISLAFRSLLCSRNTPWFASRTGFPSNPSSTPNGGTCATNLLLWFHLPPPHLVFYPLVCILRLTSFVWSLATSCSVKHTSIISRESPSRATQVIPHLSYDIGQHLRYSRFKLPANYWRTPGLSRFLPHGSRQGRKRSGTHPWSPTSKQTKTNIKHRISLGRPRYRLGKLV